jgi:hypothetical protein
MKAAVGSTNTTLAPAWTPSQESLVAVPNPGPAPLPSTTTTFVVMNPDRTAPGVELTPPYQSPTVTWVGPVTCTERPEAPDNYTLSFTASLTGGRYWIYPSGGGNGHLSSFTVSTGDPVRHSRPFEFNLDWLYVRTPAETTPIKIQFTPAVPVRCPSQP